MATIQKYPVNAKFPTSYRILVYAGKDKNGKKLKETKTIKADTLQSRVPKKQYAEVLILAKEFEDEVRRRSSPDIPSPSKVKLNTFTNSKEDSDSKTGEPLPSPWAQWLNNRVAAGFIKKSSVFSYQNDYRLYCKDTFDNMTLDEITPAFAKKFISEMQTEKHYSAETTKHALSCMRCLYRYIIDETGIVSENPFQDVKVTKAKHEKKITSFYSEDETRRFLDVLDTEFTIKKTYSRKGSGKTAEYEIKYSVSNKWKAFFKTMITTGLRTGEMIALTWDFIDYDNSTIKVKQAVSRVGSRSKDREISDTKTNESLRTLRTSQMALDALKDWKQEQIERATNMGSEWKGKPVSQFGNQLIFPQDDGFGFMNGSTAGHVFHKIVRRWNAYINQQYPELAKGWEQEEPDKKDKEAAQSRKHIKKADDTRVRPDDDGIHLREIRGYDLRHTFATFELEHGTAPNVLARRMGHSNLQMIMQTYVHPFDDAAKNDANTFDQLSTGKSSTAKQLSEEEKLRKDLKETMSALNSQINSMDIEELQSLLNTLKSKDHEKGINEQEENDPMKNVARI